MSRKRIHAECNAPSGIKLAFRTFLPHHTHLAVKTIKLTASLMTCAMHAGELVSPSYFDALCARSMVVNETSQERPPLDKMPPEPGPDAGDKERSLHERALLQLNPDVGYDWRRWWGHSALERDWSNLPDPNSFRPEIDPTYPKYTAEGFAPDHRRQTMFANVVIVSYRQNAIVSQIKGVCMLWRSTEPVLPLHRTRTTLPLCKLAVDFFLHRVCSNQKSPQAPCRTKCRTYSGRGISLAVRRRKWRSCRHLTWTIMSVANWPK